MQSPVACDAGDCLACVSPPAYRMLKCPIIPQFPGMCNNSCTSHLRTYGRGCYARTHSPGNVYSLGGRAGRRDGGRRPLLFIVCYFRFRPAKKRGNAFAYSFMCNTVLMVHCIHVGCGQHPATRKQRLRFPLSLECIGTNNCVELSVGIETYGEIYFYLYDRETRLLYVILDTHLEQKLKN